MSKISRRGVTLIESIIGIVISALLIGVLMKFLGFGLRSSQSGIMKLHNIGAASILMAQIEYDLMRATRFVSPAVGETANSAQFEFLADSTGTAGRISYAVDARGITRTVTAAGETKKYTFGKTESLSISFDNLNLDSAGLGGEKVSILIALFVASKDTRTGQNNEFKLLRLVTCRNIEKD